MQELEALQKIESYTRLKQTRIYVLAILELPLDVKERTPQSILKKAEGTILLGFSAYPQVGEEFPYEKNIWRLEHRPVQIPEKYYGRKPKHSAIIKPTWIDSYDKIEDAIAFILKNA